MNNRGKAIKDWLSNRENLILLGILAISFAVRLYYFFLTKNQALWWDEAEYMLKAKSIALGTPATGFWEGRPILFSVILSGFYYLGLGEISIRIALLLVSLASVYLVYYIGRKLFDKKIGLISAFLYSLFYLNLFYSVRIMVDVLSLTLGLLAFAFYLSENKRLIWPIIPILVIATLIRFPSFFFFIILLMFILINEGFAALKKKEYWVSAVIGTITLIPYLIWSQIKFGNALYAIFYAGEGAVSGITLSSAFAVFMQYINSFPSYLHIILLIFFIIGLILFYDVLLGLDLVRKHKLLKNKSFILIWIVLILGYFGFAVSHFEDRYIFGAFPAIFYIIALGINKTVEVVKKYDKYISVGVLTIVVLGGGFQLIKSSDQIIKERVDSFGPVKEAGLWIKEHTNPGDKIMVRSHPQNTYYSERESYTIPIDEESFIGNFTEIKPKYLIISLFDSPTDQKWWGYNINYTKYGLTGIKGIPQSQPILVIYKTSY
jgi:4-amino-4-deoxy-L-arabinose transferase-like glycosyltransferase